MATRGPKLKILPFEPYGDRLNLGKRWEKWSARFERDIKYNGIDLAEAGNSDIVKMVLLMCAGNDLEDLHDTIPDVIKPENVTDDNWMNYARSKAKLSGYFSPITCNDFALFELMTLKLESHENISSYVTRLRQAAAKCNFDAWSDEKMIKCVLISNMKDDTLRIKFLQKVHALQEIVDFIRKREDATACNKIIEEEKGSESRYSNTHRVEKNRKWKIESKEVQSDSRRYESKGRKKEYGRGKKGKDNIALRKACKYCGSKSILEGSVQL